MLFLKNNPIKCSGGNQICYRYCIVCGVDRFPGRDFDDTSRPRIGESLIGCFNYKCTQDVIYEVPKFIPYTYLLSKIVNEDELKFDIDIGSVYTKEQLKTLPEEYRNTFAILEEIPARYRICKIDTIISNYVESKFGIEVIYKAFKGEIDDAFLQTLIKYRRMTVEKSKEPGAA